MKTNELYNFFQDVDEKKGCYRITVFVYNTLAKRGTAIQSMPRHIGAGIEIWNSGRVAGNSLP
jgi:hypothetical protein